MSRLRIKDAGVAWRAIEDEVVILDIDKSVYLSVNKVGARLWETLAGRGASRDQLAQELVESFALSQDQARSDVDHFVDALTEAGLLEEEP